MPPEKLHEDLNRVQFLTFFYEIGCYYLAKGDYELALAKFYGLIKQFAKFHEDTIDFYYLSVQRAYTIEPYVDLVKNLDKFHNNRIYVYSAKHIADIYLLYHNGEIQRGSGVADSASSRRKKKKDAKKNERSARKDDCAKPPTHQSEPNCLAYVPSIPFLPEDQPLEKASAVIHEIIMNDAKYPQIYETGYKVYFEKGMYLPFARLYVNPPYYLLRKGKFLLALRCLCKMKNDTLLMSKARLYALRLVLALSDLDLKNKYPDRVYQKFISILKSIISVDSTSNDNAEITTEYLIKENEKFMELYGHNPSCRASGLKYSHIIKDTSNYGKWIGNFNSSIDVWNVSHDDCVETYKMLENLDVGCRLLDDVKSTFSSIFVFSPFFQS